jgi:hypothetical protein
MAAMKYRKLRIAWSVGWGVLCLLLVVLWVRSYGQMDSIDSISATGQYSGLVSHHGRITFVKGYNGANAFREFIFAVPHWFVSLVFFVVAALPCIPWSNRFSLRTLLIGMTVVAVVLGSVIWAVR